MGEKSLVEIINRATDTKDQWDAILCISDFVNSYPQRSVEVLNIIRKKMGSFNGKNWTIFNNCLNLIEAMTNNCGPAFHIVLDNKEFMHEFTKYIQPKYKPPLDIQNRILKFIKLWSIAFQARPNFKHIEDTYQQLLTRGIPFDEITTKDIEQIPKIPPPSSKRRTEHNKPVTHATNRANNQSIRINENNSNTLKLDSSELKRIDSELIVTQNNLVVFDEMLSVGKSMNNNQMGSSNDQLTSNDLDLLTELHITLKEMQRRISRLLQLELTEELTGKLLKLNDDIISSFNSYDNWKNPNTGSAKPVAKKCEIKPIVNSKGEKDEQLIDISLDDQKPPGLIDDENDLKEMEKWMKAEDPTYDPASNEFDAFLRERTQMLNNNNTNLNNVNNEKNELIPNIYSELDNANTINNDERILTSSDVKVEIDELSSNVKL
ncbi:hypothetical protein SNEBB_010357 [Seison nebaliae]|nr:hypothetical protein SNEBB_010357 [Seison nebaliae]